MGETIAAFLPSLVATFVILAVGWLVSKGIEVVAARGLRRFGLDRAAGRLPIDRTLEEAGISSPPSRIVARLIFWVLMLTFILSAVETLGLNAVTATIDRLIAYLPNVVAAGLIVVLGLLLGRFVGSVIGSAAVAANLAQAARLGAAAQSVVVMLIAVLALEQLGIDTRILIVVISVGLGALALTLGVAFALGARPVIAHILAGHFLRQSLEAGTSVEIGGRRGNVERVGPVDTLFSNEQGRWSLPNSRVLEEQIDR